MRDPDAHPSLLRPWNMPPSRPKPLCNECNRPSTDYRPKGRGVICKGCDPADE